MTNIEFRSLLECSEALLEEIEHYEKGRSKQAYLIGSILISWIALEACINSIMEDFSRLPEDFLSTHERGFLQEKSVKLKDRGDDAGEFYITDQQEFKRLEDKILFLLAKFGSGRKILRGDTLWQRFDAIKVKRNSLVHPKKDKATVIGIEDAREAIEVAKGIISFLSKEVWKQEVKW